MAQIRLTRLALTVVLLSGISREALAANCGPANAQCPQECSEKKQPHVRCDDTTIGNCCCPSYKDIVANHKELAGAVQVEVTTPPPPGLCYWIAEWSKKDQKGASVTPLDPAIPRRSERECVAVIATSHGPQGLGDQDAVQKWVRAGLKPLPATSPMFNLFHELEKRKAICSTAGIDEKAAQLKKMLAEQTERAIGAEQQRTRLQLDLQQSQNALIDTQRSNRDLQTAADAQITREKVATRQIGELETEKAALEAKNQKLREKIPAHWLKWTALAIAVASSAWAGVEINNLRSASNAYDHAPAGSSDLGAKHIDVVAAKGRLGAAGVATVLGWTWYLSLVEW
jgi:hypothetical protein